MIIAETDRLIIRQYNEEDEQFVLQILKTRGGSQFIGTGVTRNLLDTESYITEKFITSYIKYGLGMYIVVLKEKNIPIGISGLENPENLEHVDIGYSFLPGYRGKGYVIESVIAILKYAKPILQVRSILAIVTPDNKKFIVLLQKLNNDFEKTITEYSEELKDFKNKMSSLTVNIV